MFSLSVITIANTQKCPFLTIKGYYPGCDHKRPIVIFMMGRLNTFEVFVDNPYGEVAVGSSLHGQIVLDCSDDMEVREISVMCYGRCHVELTGVWTSMPLTDSHFWAFAPLVVNESYMNDRINKCFPSETTNNSAILPKGLHVFDFDFPISQNTPASFEGDRGYVRHLIRAVVCLPGKDENNIRDFKVLPVYDLNCLTNIESPIEVENEEEFSSLYFKKIGHCRGKLSLPKGGFVPGELLHVQVNIENDTAQDINAAVLKLKMVTTYHLRYQSQKCEKVLAVSKVSPIAAGYSFQGCDRNLRIPKDVQPSGIYACRYILIQYIVELNVRPNILHMNMLKLSTRIEVGTVPLSTERVFLSLMMRQPPPEYDDLPPSYTDALKNLIPELQQTGDDDINRNDTTSDSNSSRDNNCSINNSNTDNRTTDTNGNNDLQNSGERTSYSRDVILSSRDCGQDRCTCDNNSCNRAYCCRNTFTGHWSQYCCCCCSGCTTTASSYHFGTCCEESMFFDTDNAETLARCPVTNNRPSRSQENTNLVELFDVLSSMKMAEINEVDETSSCTCYLDMTLSINDDGNFGHLNCNGTTTCSVLRHADPKMETAETHCVCRCDLLTTVLVINLKHFFSLMNKASDIREVLSSHREYHKTGVKSKTILLVARLLKLLQKLSNLFKKHNNYAV